MGHVESPGLSLLLTQLTKRIFRRSDEDAMGMRMRHFVTLGFLRGSGAVPQQLLGEMLCTDANNLVILLNELESEGFVVRRRDAVDRRRHIVEITTAGRRAVAKAERVQLPQEQQVISALSADELAELRRLLIRALGGGEDAEAAVEPILAHTAP